jgi:hypothetical protein
MYSECAQTRGQAEPEGLPRNNSSAGISAASQTCSGSKRPWPAVHCSITVSRASASLRGGLRQVRSERALRRAAARGGRCRCHRRPSRPRVRHNHRRCSGTSTGPAAVARATERVDDANRIQNAGIIGARNPKRTKRQRVRADDAEGALRVLSVFAGRAILDGNEALGRRRGGIGVRRSDAHVVAFHADLLGRDRRRWRKPSVRCCRSRHRRRREE